MDENEYSSALAAKGYAPAATKTWAAGRVNERHDHDRDLYLFVVKGELTIVMNGEAHRLTPGYACEVPGGTPHAEHVGPEGVTFLVASRS